MPVHIIATSSTREVTVSKTINFNELYENCFPAAASFVSKMHGSLQEAKDIFHDALVIFYEKSAEKNLNVKTTPEAYLIGIVKHLWIRKYNHNHKQISLTKIEESINIPEDHNYSVNSNKLLNLIESTGKKCLELLRAFYYQQLPHSDIMSVFGYSSAHSASVQKFKCIEKIRETLKEKSIAYEDFLE